MENPFCWDNIKDIMTSPRNAEAELLKSLLIPTGPNSFLVYLL